jgi:hypothetical protein
LFSSGRGLLPSSRPTDFAIALQESNRDAPQATWPTREQHSSMTGGIDTHMGKSAHSSDVTGLTGKDSIGQPINKPSG